MRGEECSCSLCRNQTTPIADVTVTSPLSQSWLDGMKTTLEFACKFRGPFPDLVSERRGSYWGDMSIFMNAFVLRLMDSLPSGTEREGAMVKLQT